MIPKKHWSLILTQLLKCNTKMVDKKGKKIGEGSHPSSYFRKMKIDTVNKTDKSKTYNRTVDTLRSNKTYKVKSIDK